MPFFLTLLGYLLVFWVWLLILNLVYFGCILISAQIKLVNRRMCLQQHVVQQLKLFAAEQAQLRNSLPGSQGAAAAVCLSLPISLPPCSLWGLLLLVQCLL